MPLSRRDLLTRGGAAGLGIVLAGSTDVVFGRTAGAAPVNPASRGAQLVPDPKGVLDLPRGFRYTVLSEAGQPLKSGGGAVPGKHDGMSTFRRGTDTFLVRNHEQGSDAEFPVVAPASHTYDPSAKGGCSTLQVDAKGQLVAERVSLGGTAVNCAGGPTPWGTWLTCEETETNSALKTHGWVFEVDPLDEDRNAEPTPLTGLGRYPHEAVAVDPVTGYLYLTEDASGPLGLFYRFRPNSPLGGYGSLRDGGTLEAMWVPGLASDDLSSVVEPGTVFGDVQWVPVPDPLATTVSTRKQFRYAANPTGQRITRSRKLEGCWFGSDEVYFVASYARAESAGRHEGQVWRYDPRAGTVELYLRFEPGGRFDGPDNITVSPYGGGVILAEDGDGEQYLIAAGPDKGQQPVAFARNALNDSEFAGVTYDERIKTLFANIQTPGLTLAITGPFERYLSPYFRP